MRIAQSPCPRATSAGPFKKLHRAFVLLRGFTRMKSSQVAAAAGFGVFFPGIQPVFAGLELANHIARLDRPDSGFVSRAPERQLEIVNVAAGLDTPPRLTITCCDPVPIEVGTSKLICITPASPGVIPMN